MSQSVHDSLPDLTDKQYKFVQGILSGLTASDAYRQAYDCERMAAPTITAHASRLRNDDKVTAWLDIAKQTALERAVVTLEAHTAELERIKALALGAGNYGAALKAEELKGRATGLYIDKHQDVTEDDPQQIMEEIEKKYPTLARLLQTDGHA